MYTEENVKNLSTLRIHKLTQAQYDRESSNDALEENSIYLTPYEANNGDNLVTIEQLNSKADLEHRHIIDEIDTLQEKLDENLQSAEKYTDEQIKNKIGENNVANLINIHNGSEEAHNDIRVIIDELNKKINEFLSMDESTVDKLTDILDLIEENKGDLESLASTKINITDIIDNVSTNSSDKVLSAKQGYELKKLINILRSDVDSKVPNTRKINGKSLNSDITLAADDIKTGTFSYDRFPTVPVTKGGTGADKPEQALINLGINATAAEINILDEAIISTKELNYLKSVTNPIQSQLDGKASLDHSHSASDINSGELFTSVLPVIPIEKGGTGASDPEGALIGFGFTATADEINTLSGVNITTDELNFLSGVKSNLQNQIDSKQDEITGGASSIVSSNLTKNRVLISNNSGKVAVSDITSTELGYLDGVTSSIQDQLNDKVSKAYGSIYISDGALIGHSAQTTSDEITFIAGNNISISGKNNGDSFSITIAATDTTYENATKDSPGLMSDTDKTKLDGIPSNANYYVHETGSGYNHIPSGGSSGQFLKYSSSGTAAWSTIPTASSSTLGGIKVGTGLSISSSKLSVSNPLPSVTTSNNGQFLRVVNGAWAAVTIKTAESEAL